MVDESEALFPFVVSQLTGSVKKVVLPSLIFRVCFLDLNSFLSLVSIFESLFIDGDKTGNKVTNEMHV